MRVLVVASQLMVACLLLVGCHRYTTPGGPANFASLGIVSGSAEASTDPQIAERLSRRPVATFPASVAAIRLQDRGYHSYSSDGWGKGRVTVVSVRDVEKQEHLERVSDLPLLRELVPVTGMVLTKSIESESDLRNAAAELQCELVAVYTFDTSFSSDTTIPYLGVISLGLLPNEVSSVTATASAALLDTRTGFVYGVYESTAKSDRLSNAWGTQSAMDAARKNAESRAFDGLVTEFESGWRRVIARYAGYPSEPAR
jgi:hypothetical protein